MDPIIRVRNVTYTYPETNQPALRDVSLDVQPGTFVSILGANGSGKSTLAKHLNAILLPQAGKVLVDGMDTIDEGCLIPIRRKVGMVFQNPDNQIVANVVEDDVAFAPENLGVEPREIRRRVDEALRQVDMYSFRLHAPHLLSGGQKQRVAIAGVLAMEPEVLVLDEPTAMLDPRGREEVIATTRKLCREKGITVLLITHHMEEAVCSDRVVLLDQGQIVMDGPPKDIFPQASRLRELHLTVPDTTALLEKLAAAGMPVDLSALTEEECAATIREALS